MTPDLTRKKLTSILGPREKFWVFPQLSYFHNSTWVLFRVSFYKPILFFFFFGKNCFFWLISQDFFLTYKVNFI